MIEDPTFLWALRAGQLFAGVLTVVVAINLAVLVYARTVTRLGEIAVRSALGASRRRILAQLFIESFVLTLVGAAAGLGLARYSLGVIQALNDAEGGLAYWVNFDLSPDVVMFALGLAVGLRREHSLIATTALMYGCSEIPSAATMSGFCTPARTTRPNGVRCSSSHGLARSASVVATLL